MEHDAEDTNQLDSEEHEEEDEVPRKRNRFTSIAWKHFTETESGRYCNYYNAKYGLRTATSSLLRHMADKHTDIMNADDAEEPFDENKMHRLISILVASNYLSLSIVDHPDLRALFAYALPKYAVPGRKKLTGELMPRLREQLEEAMLTKVNSIRALSLSVDSWTSMANEIFLAVTCHGITSNWILESFLLEAVPVYEDETGAHIAETIQEVLEYWKIPTKRVISITSDGAANVRNAIEAVLQSPWIYCAAHVINRAVRLALDCEEVKPLIEKCKMISRFFRSSPKASRMLTQKQQALHLPVLRMKIDNKTRWGSAHDMMERLYKVRPAISACLAMRLNVRRKMPEDLSPSEWASVDGMLRVLKPFKDCTEFLSQERHPTIGVVFPLIHRLIHKHMKVTPQTRAEDGTLVGTFKAVVASDLQERWNTMIDASADAVYLSTFLDPRLKAFAFIADTDERKVLQDKCVHMAQGWLSSPSPTSSQSLINETNDEEEEESTPTRAHINRLFGESLAANISTSIGGPVSYKEELASYLRIAPLPLLDRTKDGRTIHSDPLAWWATHQQDYPHLARLAKRFLAITATSVPSERAFSRGGSIVSKKRCSLAGSNVSMLMFVACNRHHLGKN